MENSSIDAVLIGVNVFIFIIALTFSIMLMSTVLDMSNAVSTEVKTYGNSSILESIGSVEEKRISGTEVYAYFLKQGDEKFYIENIGKSKTKLITAQQIRLDSEYILKTNVQTSIEYVFEEVD